MEAETTKWAAQDVIDAEYRPRDRSGRPDGRGAADISIDYTSMRLPA